MTPITAAIITFNEEKNIQRCIESLLPIADEIVIIDSFSTDKTKEIATSYDKVRFIEHIFDGHIQQKNIALQTAQNNWVISLDADEALTPELTQSILAAFQNPTADGYKFNRLTYYCGHWVKYCGWYPDTKIRLVKKDNAEWRGENPHDRLEVINGNTIVHLKGDLLHYSYYSAEQHFKQIEYFGEIASKAAFQKGKRTNWLLIYLKTGFQFIKSFILQRGILDGKTGWLISKRSAFATYVKYTKLLKLKSQ
jgi:glycosyltransferase involved in cell wall biosynthesis